MSRPGCDLYLYDVAPLRARSQLLDRLTRSDALEYQPAVSDGKVAFVRVFDRRSGVAGVVSHIYVGDLFRPSC